MSTYGIASVIVWGLSEYFHVRTSYRIVLFVLIVLTIPFTLLGSYLYTQRSKKKNEEKDSKKKGDGNKGDAPTAEPSAEITKGADEVVQFLKSSDLGSSGNALYSLPWYFVAGTRGSGKTALILGSGLDFKALPSQRQAELKYITPTRNVDWRVTSDAVFIDTPGRFQADGPDSAEWASLLQTVKKQRSNRPLDGFILTVNTEKILNADERDIDELAKQLRARLDDATKFLKTRFPVYLVFTHADAIEGFRDSFSVSKKEGENLVWGSTIPLENSDNAQALFDSEFEILQKSLMQRRLIRLSAPFTPVRQLKIFNFPLHFASARRKLGAFTSTLFRPNPFSESPFLRGFYFTAVPVNRNRKRSAKGTPETVDKTYFTHKLFSDVILRDRDMVKTFQEQRQRPPVLGWLLTIAGTFITLVLLGLSGYSLYRNKAFIDDARAKGEAVLAMNKADRGADPLTKSPRTAQDEINQIEDLRAILAQMDDYDRNGAPWYMRMGLYSGNRLLHERLMNIYYSAVERRFRQPTIRRLEQELKAFANGTQTAPPSEDKEAKRPEQAREDMLERNYNLLKAYLLLSEKYKDHAKDKSAPSDLVTALGPYWMSESKIPPGSEARAREQLRFYFKQVDRESEYAGDTSGFPRITPDSEIVKEVRAKLVDYPAYKRYLNRQITEITNELGEISVDSLLGGSGNGVLEGSVKISAAFTIAGYRGYMRERIKNANTVLSEDDWVMGEEGKAEAIKSDELLKLETDYFNKYAANWARLIGGTKVPAYKTDQEMIDALDSLSGAESPMKLFLQEVVKNTDLSAKPPAKSWFDLSWITDIFSGSGGDAEIVNNKELENQFSLLFDFVGDSSGKAAPIDEYAKRLGQIADKLRKASDRDMREFKRQLANDDPGAKSFSRILGAVEDEVGKLTKGFDTAGTREAAKLLKMPLQNVRIKFGADSKTQIARTWSDTVLKEAKSIETGYPFVNSSNSVTDLKAVSNFLNPQNGTLTTFYNNRLKNFFDGDPDTGLKVKDDSPVKFTPEFVAYLNNAFKLRKALFGTSPTPGFEYDFIISKEGGTVVVGTIDGTQVSSRDTGSFKLKFPAQSGINGVSLNILSANSTVSTDQGSQSAPMNLNFPGEWGLFKFVDAASSKSKTQSGYNLTYSRGGMTARIQIRPLGGDPFDRSLFSAIRAPAQILQQ